VDSWRRGGDTRQADARQADTRQTPARGGEDGWRRGGDDRQTPARRSDAPTADGPRRVIEFNRPAQPAAAAGGQDEWRRDRPAAEPAREAGWRRGGDATPSARAGPPARDVDGDTWRRQQPRDGVRDGARDGARDGGWRRPADDAPQRQPVAVVPAAAKPAAVAAPRPAPGEEDEWTTVKK